MRVIIFSIVALFAITSCSNGEKENSAKKENLNEENSKISSAGKSLMENKCYSCHSPKVAKEYALAPPMIEVKTFYLNAYPNEKEFNNAFQDFLSKPTKDKAIMKEAVEKHGLMPYQGSSEEEISKIATYIYSTDIEKPEWWEKQDQSNSEKISFSELGLKYALTTKKTLGKTLMTAIEEKGTKGALSFCNTRAIPITDSMSHHFNATIRRVSDKPRNPNNRANKKELEQIEFFKSTLKAKNEIQPVTIEKENKVSFYYPIITNGMCLQCHGTKKETINEATVNQIAQLYPSDKATGYKENEVRGIWSIVFKK